MTIVTSPPEQPQIDEAQLLFKEARQRRRRRWLVAGVAVTVAIAGVIIVGVSLGTRPPVQPPASRAPTATAPPTRSVTGPAGTPQVAWVDNLGQLHIGDISGFTQRVVAQADADPTTPLVTAGSRVFWVRSQKANPDGTVTPIPSPKVFGFDTATEKTVQIAAGTQVMASVDRTFIYVETGPRHLTEYWPDGKLKGQTLRLPDGWFLLSAGLSTNPTPVIANGILVVSTASPHTTLTGEDGTLAVWNPSSGNVQALG